MLLCAGKAARAIILRKHASSDLAHVSCCADNGSRGELPGKRKQGSKDVSGGNKRQRSWHFLEDRYMLSRLSQHRNTVVTMRSAAPGGNAEEAPANPAQ